jgi:low affinity Fe/Cu permease
LIQNTQNRDITSVQLKLDELIRATDGARNQMMRLEEIPDSEMDLLKQQFTELKSADAEKQELGPESSGS